jgi:RNA polymerase sigma-70 factor, ECF subfamily
MKEKHIIQAVLEGDAEQYRLLVERYQTGLIIHCENLMKNRADGEDIAQEAFIKAYQSLKNFDDDKARFSTWLYKIATNKAIDHLRKKKRSVNVEDIEQFADITMLVEVPEDEIMLLRQAVDGLEPPVYSQVIKAYFWEGKSYQEIARELDVTTNTVGTWMHRAKAQLKEAIA